MVTVKIIGGLGNQMFCIGYGLVVAQYLQQPITVDISDFYQGYFRKYLLDYFNLPKMARIWYMPSFPSFAETMNVPKELQNEYDLILNVDEVKTREELLEKVGGYSNVYLYGYGGSHLFCQDDLKLLKEYFEPKYDDLLLKQFDELLEKNENTVAVHIRRTDFISLGWSSDDALYFYKASINYFRTNYPDVHFYLFSDDIVWVKEHFSKEIDCTCFDSFGGEVQSLYDWICMTRCKHHVVTNGSTYSKWSCLLGKASEGIVLCQESGKGEQYDKYAYSNLDVIFWNKEDIFRYLLEADDVNETRVATEECFDINSIEQYLYDNESEAALKIINSMSLDQIKTNIEEKREYIVELKAVAYLQMGLFELAGDIYEMLLKKQNNKVDYLYNYAVALLMGNNRLEALCYAGMVKLLNRESDIDTIVVPENDEEKRIYDLFSSGKVNQIRNVNLVFMTAYATKSINKFFISMELLMKNLGFNVKLWRLGIENIEDLQSMFSCEGESIILTNMYETCISDAGFPILFYVPSCRNDIDAYYYNQYDDNKVKAINEKVNSRIESGRCDSVCMGISKQAIYTWNTCVNSDDVVWGIVRILESLVIQ